jgi:hypothetical protein
MFSISVPAAVPSFRDQEDSVQKILDDWDPDALALLYKSLYARGYRISTVDAQIAKLKKRCSVSS